MNKLYKPLLTAMQKFSAIFIVANKCPTFSKDVPGILSIVFYLLKKVYIGSQNS